jgi:hypothetical protein
MPETKGQIPDVTFHPKVDAGKMLSPLCSSVDTSWFMATFQKLKRPAGQGHTLSLRTETKEPLETISITQIPKGHWTSSSFRRIS